MQRLIDAAIDVARLVTQDAARGGLISIELQAANDLLMREIRAAQNVLRLQEINANVAALHEVKDDGKVD